MAYIGKQPVVGNFVKLDAITTSATTTFNLTNGGVAYSPQSANHCIVSLNGVIQSPNTSFTISGSTIVFASALTSTDVIDFILVLGDVLNIGTPSDNTVTASKIADGVIGLGKLSATGTKDSTTFLRGDNTFSVPAGSKFGTQLLHVRDEKSSGTAGGGSTSGSFLTRDLNTVMTNEITGASLSSNQITLPSGTYYINARAPAYNVDEHKLKLRNITDSSDTIIGSSEQNADLDYDSAFLTGRFTIASQKTFELQHRFGFGAANGFGLACSFSVVEVYADVQIWKVA